MSFIYNKTTGVNSAAIGKLETPIRMIIEHESDLQKKSDDFLKALFNVEKSSRFGETIIGGNEFDVFKATAEGGRAENDSVRETYKKFIEHIQFMKEFTITAEMYEDSINGIAANVKGRAENFTRAYYKTRNQIAQYALAAAAKKQTSGRFAGALLDLTAQDGKALFAEDHTYGYEGDTQSNIITKSGAFADEASLEEALAEAAVTFRNFKDENGDPLGYTPDTILLRGDDAKVERLAKKVCGTEQASGEGNYINTQYGGWNVIILPSWLKGADTDASIMLMSSEANKNLSGNMFYNRIPLTINSFVDPHTSDYVWTGRCRFGVGFGNYKHIALLTSGT